MRTQDEVAGMNCPVCRVPLAMSDRQGIEIDYCPQCRGVWLDRGELDKIIDRAAEMEQQPQRPAPPQPQAQPHYERYDDRRSSYPQQPYSKKKKRESWLSELFD